MNSENYLGASNWRLPTASPINGSSYNYSSGYDGSTDRGYNVGAPGTLYAGSTASEMAHMFYSTLGNVGYLNTSGGQTGCSGAAAPYCLTDTGPFSNIQTRGQYWTDSNYLERSWQKWIFQFGGGLQDRSSTVDDGYLYVWAVSDGDTLAPVPVPGAVWLFGGALGLLGVVRRRTES
jgi:hypothetical protein